MGFYDVSGQGRSCTAKYIAAGQTTSQVSVAGDNVPNKDYLERVILTAATTAVGAVTVFDGTNVIVLTHNAQVTGFLGSNVTVYELGLLATTTKGFNITTGSSITCCAVGRF